MTNPDQERAHWRRAGRLRGLLLVLLGCTFLPIFGVIALVKHQAAGGVLLLIAAAAVTALAPRTWRNVSHHWHDGGL